MNKVVVTGANGFVGTHVVKALSARGCQVLAVIKDEQENISAFAGLANVTIVYCDLESIARLPEAVASAGAGTGYDTFFHLAWIGSAGPLRADHAVQLQNAAQACEAVEAAARLGCRRFIFAASIMEYECAEIIRQEKDFGLGHIYSAGKIAAHYMTRAVAGRLGLEHVSAVISNIYGPGETSPRLINTTLRKLLRGEPTAFTSGEQTYDFIYITDAAAAMVAIGESGHASRSYYLGSQNPRPLRTFLIELRNCIDPEIELGLGLMPFEGVSLDYASLFDIQAVQRDTGFVPEVSFSEGIARTVVWMRGSLPGT